MEVKKCKCCQEVKPIADFYSAAKFWRKKTQDWGVYYDALCKPCKGKRQKESDTATPERAARIREQQRAYHKNYYRKRPKIKPGFKPIIVRDAFGKIWEVVSIVAQPDDGTGFHKLLFSVKEPNSNLK